MIPELPGLFDTSQSCAMAGLGTRRRRGWTAAILLVGVAALVVLARRSRGPSAAERWMEARRAEGEKFSLAELGWEDRPVFASALLTVIEEEHGALQRFLRPPGPAEAFVEQPPTGRRTVLWKEPHMLSVSQFQASWELMEAQLRAVEPALVEVRRALQTIVADPGGDYTLSVPIRYVALRETAQVLADAMILELHRAQPDRALANLLSLVRLSRQHEDYFTLINQVMRNAVTELAIAMTWQALQWPGWSDAQLEALQSELTQCALLDPFLHTLEAGRATGLHWHALLRSEDATALARVSVTLVTGGSKWLERAHLKIWKAFWSDRDLLCFLEYYQAYLETFRAMARGAAWRSCLQRLDAQPHPADLMQARFLGIRYNFGRFSAMVVPNFPRVLITVTRTETQRRLALLAVALERYRRRHGAWPPDLQSLVPQCITELPLDPYSAQPFLYDPGSTETPRLGSVGPTPPDTGDGGASGSVAQDPEGSNREPDFVWPIATEK